MNLTSTARARSIHLLASCVLASLAGCDGQFGDPGPRRPGSGSESEVAPAARPACDEELQLFDQELWRPILAVRCIGCHSEQGAAAGTRMVLRPGTDAATLEANFEALSRVALATAGEDIPLLLLKPTGEHPDGHTGGRLVGTGSLDFERLRAFVDVVKSPSCDTPAVGASCEGRITYGAPSIRRLTPSEYDRSVEALFGSPSSHGGTFPADPVVDGYANQAAALTVSPLLASQLREAARDIVATATPRIDDITGCAGHQTEACVRTFLVRFGREAFRRNLLDTEVESYVGLYRGASTGGFEAGVGLALTAMLQSPHFLYRTELGVDQGDGIQQLTGPEIAASMSYLLTGGPPDEALRTAADAGELDTPAGRRTAATRLLNSAGARAAFSRFVRAWLNLDRVATVPKDDATYPLFSAALRQSMVAEVDAFVESVVFDGDGSFGALLTTPSLHPDTALAAFYGVGAPAQPHGAVADPTRSGLLTLGAVLSVAAGPEAPSPVLRGRMVRQALLCQPLPDPPPGLVAEPPPVDPNVGVRQRWSEHSELEPCASCHRLMDPIGFAFEAFDAVGRHRTQEPNGLPVDIDGEILGTRESDGTVHGVKELGAHLAASREVQDCFVSQWFRYAYGAVETSATRCALLDLQDRFVQSGLSIRALMLATVEDPHFIRRAAVSRNAPLAPPDTPEPPVTPDPTPDAPAPDAPPPPATNFEVQNNVDSEWPTGACHRVVVTNRSDTKTAWSIVIQIPGTMNNHWNAEATATTGEVTFTGSTWNRQLDPGASADFGFCYQR